MGECYNCGRESDSGRMFDVISKEGIVKVCEFCFKNENIPVVKRPTTFQLREAEVPSTVYERLSGIAGLDAKEHFKKFHKEEIKKKEALKEQDVSLKELVDRNYKREFKPVNETNINLINNFHWVIMRARRMKKITQAQLARELFESQAAIEMAEKGILPEDGYQLVRKLENFLGIRILKESVREEFVQKPKQLDIEDIGTRELTIADLKEMKQEAEYKILGKEIEIEEDILDGGEIDRD
ncbi:MAG: hypothetical protein ABIH59_03190 [archaeon]